ncbi:MAG TPA: hypothetical protein VKE30_02340 [Chthoniobacterales bacterium]|nr:hypothetical protein [Chthoniobacterales bacterium]
MAHRETTLCPLKIADVGDRSGAIHFIAQFLQVSLLTKIPPSRESVPPPAFSAIFPRRAVVVTDFINRVHSLDAGWKWSVANCFSE